MWVIVGITMSAMFLSTVSNAILEVDDLADFFNKSVVVLADSPEVQSAKIENTSRISYNSLKFAKLFERTYCKIKFFKTNI